MTCLFEPFSYPVLNAKLLSSIKSIEIFLPSNDPSLVAGSRPSTIQSRASRITDWSLVRNTPVALIGKMRVCTNAVQRTPMTISSQRATPVSKMLIGLIASGRPTKATV